MVIKELELRAFRGGEKPEVDIYLECSKGTYVRSLAEDLGQALGCGALSVRCAGPGLVPLAIEDSVSLSTLEALKDNDELEEMDSCYCPPTPPWVACRWCA